MSALSHMNRGEALFRDMRLNTRYKVEKAKTNQNINNAQQEFINMMVKQQLLPEKKVNSTTPLSAHRPSSSDE